MSEFAISARGVGKKFKIYKDKPLTLKDRALSVIKKSYDEFWALKDISLNIEKGEAVGLIGHNGCGKSTLLKLFTRIIYADEGEIEVNGKVSSLLELGAGFHPDFTGLENIYTNASIFGLKRAETEKLIPEIIEFSELGEFIDNPVRTYSSGMYMRLAFSVAIHVCPEILLVDEILAVGDSNFQQKCIEKILEFKNNGVTIVIVSHDLATVERICDRVVWLDAGQIIKQGNPKSVINAYLERMAENKNEKLLAQKERAAGSEEDKRTRWGDKSIEITSVELFDGDGKKRSNFDPEGRMVISIYYKINKPVSDVGFGIGIFGSDGVQRYGTNTYIDGALVDIKQNGKISFVMDRLGFMEGCYRLDVAAHDRAGTPYDYILDIVKFRTSSPISDVGMVRPPHRWEN